MLPNDFFENEFLDCSYLIGALSRIVLFLFIVSALYPREHLDEDGSFGSPVETRATPSD